MALASPYGGCRWDSEGEAISTAGEWTSDYLPAATTVEECWYAVLTRSRREKLVANLLRTYGVQAYLPLVSEVHNWSDRRKTVEVPLFPGYVFVRSVDSNQAMSRVIRTEGVVRVLGTHSRGTPIPDDEIDAIKKMLDHKIPYRNHTFLEIGKRVRIRGGALDGVEGILLAHKSETSMVISITMIQRSLAIRIDGYQVEPVQDKPDAVYRHAAHA